MKDNIVNIIISVIGITIGFLFARYESTINRLDTRIDDLEVRVNNHSAKISSLETVSQIYTGHNHGDVPLNNIQDR